MKIINDVAYGNLDAQKLDVYLPDAEAESVFLYFHGGGLERGDKDTVKRFSHYLAERNIAFVSVNYRMYPDYKYPDYIYDAAMSAKWTYDYMKRELKTDKLYIGGSSAGGYLSMMLCFDKKYLASVGMDNSLVAGYFHDAGQPTTHFNILKKERGIDPHRIIVDEAAPLYHIVPGENYPPMRFIVSDDDMKNRYEQTMLTIAALKTFNYTNVDYVVMHGTHCHYVNMLDEHETSVFGKMILDFLGTIK